MTQNEIRQKAIELAKKKLDEAIEYYDIAWDDLQVAKEEIAEAKKVLRILEADARQRGKVGRK